MIVINLKKTAEMKAETLSIRVGNSDFHAEDLINPLTPTSY